MEEDAENRQEHTERDAGEDRRDRPRTALEEVVREIEEAETHADGQGRPRRDPGEAGEAITPNTRAQEESHGD
ncbi:hypothetical protein ABZY42_22365 [Streptomyces sp. NPDC006622]|uniref:hypothetical protein n=1 Tax=Streptomyces sp. NPDC006622 TaxID=3155459 RepID=UPI0033A0628B